MFGVGSFCLLPSPEEKKNSFGATIFLLLLFSRPSPFILFDFFLLFFLAALKNGTLCKGGGGP